MNYKVTLSGVTLLLAGMALSGCAPKKAWSPELADARTAYERAASNPLVTSLAPAELSEAQRQLQTAENAADYFKSAAEIAHEATLAQVKIAEAEQAARGMQAKENIRLTQAGAPVPQALPGEFMPTQGYSSEPSLAAATPHTETYGATMGATMGGSTSTELQDMAMQIAMLSNQVAQLQSQVAGQANVQVNSQAYDQVSGQVYDQANDYILLDSFDQQPAVQVGYAEPIQAVDDNDLSTYVSLDQFKDPTSEPLNEPSLGAARPAQDPSTTIIPESGETLKPSAFSTAKPVVSDALLREELRAMNARPAENGMALTLGERYFEAGSARLWDGRASRHLDNIAAVMVENTGLVIEVEAHTDNQGSVQQKNKLTANRATAIKSALVLRGVDGGRINTVGRGDTSPIADNATTLGKLQNRRVEIIFPNVDGI